MADGNIPIAYQLDDPAKARRLAEIEATLVADATATVELPNGYRFDFEATDERIVMLAEFVASERACCPFFEFAIELPPAGRRVALTLRGGDGVKDFIEQQFLGRAG